MSDRFVYIDGWEADLSVVDGAVVITVRPDSGDPDDLAFWWEGGVFDLRGVEE